MKLKIFFSIVVLLVVQVTFAQQRKPNIIVIMADDIGISNLGCYGGDIMGNHE